jgi:hypothetical protein
MRLSRQRFQDFTRNDRESNPERIQLRDTMFKRCVTLFEERATQMKGEIEGNRRQNFENTWSLDFHWTDVPSSLKTAEFSVMMKARSWYKKRKTSTTYAQS